MHILCFISIQSKKSAINYAKIKRLQLLPEIRLTVRFKRFKCFLKVFAAFIFTACVIDSVLSELNTSHKLRVALTNIIMLFI